MKTFISIRVWGDYEALRKRLRELDIKWVERDFISGFWGKEFNIERPYGKGSREKIRILRRLADPTIKINKA